LQARSSAYDPAARVPRGCLRLAGDIGAASRITFDARITGLFKTGGLENEER
jgi:hypothetical protein